VLWTPLLPIKKSTKQPNRFPNLSFQVTGRLAFEKRQEATHYA
jgi:hypothetical protein